MLLGWEHAAGGGAKRHDAHLAAALGQKSCETGRQLGWLLTLSNRTSAAPRQP